MNHAGSTFQCGCAISVETIFFAKQLDHLIEQDQENSRFFVMSRDIWGHYEFAAGWLAIDMAMCKPEGHERVVIAVSPGGAFWEVETKSKREFHGKIKVAKSSLRSMAAIDHVIYACGMARSVLQRQRVGTWIEMGPGTKDEDRGLVVGFEGLAGYSRDDMYAVGWRGEIWHFDGSAWRQLDSPTSANLNAVCCASDDKVYIVGDNGVLIRGRNDTWEVLETDRIGNLMDVSYYDGTVYVVTDFEILKLENDSLVPEDAFANPDERPATCLHLLEASDGLVSMGTLDLYRLRYGLWERLV